MLKTVKVCRLKFGFHVGQDGSTMNIVANVLIEAKLKLVVMSKKKGVSQPKM